MIVPILASTLMALDLSTNNILVALFLIIILIILFVALWKFVAPRLGQFSDLVAALIVVGVLIIIAHILGIF